MLSPSCAATMATSPRGIMPTPTRSEVCHPFDSVANPQPITFVATAAIKITSDISTVDRERKIPTSKFNPIPARKNGTRSSVTPRVRWRTRESALSASASPARNAPTIAATPA